MRACAQPVVSTREDGNPVDRVEMAAITTWRSPNVHINAENGESGVCELKGLGWNKPCGTMIHDHSPVHSCPIGVPEQKAVYSRSGFEQS